MINADKYLPGIDILVMVNETINKIKTPDKIQQIKLIIENLSLIFLVKKIYPVTQNMIRKTINFKQRLIRYILILNSLKF